MIGPTSLLLSSKRRGAQPAARYCMQPARLWRNARSSILSRSTKVRSSGTRQGSYLHGYVVFFIPLLPISLPFLDFRGTFTSNHSQFYVRSQIQTSRFTAYHPRREVFPSHLRTANLTIPCAVEIHRRPQSLLKSHARIPDDSPGERQSQRLRLGIHRRQRRCRRICRGAASRSGCRQAIHHRRRCFHVPEPL